MTVGKTTSKLEQRDIYLHTDNQLVLYRSILCDPDRQCDAYAYAELIYRETVSIGPNETHAPDLGPRVVIA